MEIQLGSNQQCAYLKGDANPQPPCSFASSIQHWSLLPSAIRNGARTPTEQLPSVMPASLDLFENQPTTTGSHNTHSYPTPGKL
jgi:hypothetical protein